MKSSNQSYYQVKRKSLLKLVLLLVLCSKTLAVFEAINKVTVPFWDRQLKKYDTGLGLDFPYWTSWTVPVPNSRPPQNAVLMSRKIDSYFFMMIERDQIAHIRFFYPKAPLTIQLFQADAEDTEIFQDVKGLNKIVDAINLMVKNGAGKYKDLEVNLKVPFINTGQKKNIIVWAGNITMNNLDITKKLNSPRFFTPIREVTEQDTVDLNEKIGHIIRNFKSQIEALYPALKQSISSAEAVRIQNETERNKRLRESYFRSNPSAKQYTDPYINPNTIKSTLMPVFTSMSTLLTTLETTIFENANLSSEAAIVKLQMVELNKMLNKWEMQRFSLFNDWIVSYFHRHNGSVPEKLDPHELIEIGVQDAVEHFIGVMRELDVGENQDIQDFLANLNQIRGHVNSILTTISPLVKVTALDNQPIVLKVKELKHQITLQFLILLPRFMDMIQEKFSQYLDCAMEFLAKNAPDVIADGMIDMPKMTIALQLTSQLPYDYPEDSVTRTFSVIKKKRRIIV